MTDKEQHFKDSVQKYIDFFKLYDYEVVIESYKRTDVRGSCVWHDLKEGAQILTIFYSDSWIKKADKKEIEKVAFHEVCEGLLSELQETAGERYVQEREITTAVHRVIARMENCVLPLI